MVTKAEAASYGTKVDSGYEPLQDVLWNNSVCNSFLPPIVDT